YGVKTLLDKNKLIYPFNNMNNMHSSFNHVDKDMGRFANHIPNTFNLSVTPKYDASEYSFKKPIVQNLANRNMGTRNTHHDDPDNKSVKYEPKTENIVQPVK